MQSWCNLREWLAREIFLQDMISLTSQQKVSYMMAFDGDYNLEYMNYCHSEHIGTLFSIGPKDNYTDSYKLQEIFHASYFKENISSLVEILVKGHETSYKAEHPDIKIKITYDRHAKPSSILIRMRTDDRKPIDPNWSVNFVLQPMASGIEVALPDTKSSQTTVRNFDLFKRYNKIKNKDFKTDDSQLPLQRYESLPFHQPSGKFKSRAESPVGPLRSKKSGFQLSKDRNIKPILITSRTINFEGTLCSTRK